MPRHERRLLDPSFDLVAAALLQAVRSARLSGPLLEETYWQGSSGRWWSTPAGRRVWDEGQGHHVSLAWWTDAIGRRHFRVVAENDRREEEIVSLPDDEDPRPPLAHVFPDRVFRRQRDGVDAWLVSCACGATGLPEALAWMGPCCGPCHDRREEQTSASRMPAHVLTTFTSPTGAETILFAPDGKTLAAADGHQRVFDWALQNGEVRVLFEGDKEANFRGLAWSPDGSQVAIGDVGRSIVVLFDLIRKQHQEIGPAEGWTGDQDRFCFLTDDQFVVGSLNGCSFWNRLDNRWVPLEVEPDEAAVTVFAVAPEGQLLAVGTDGFVLVRAAPDWRILQIIPTEDREMAAAERRQWELRPPRDSRRPCGFLYFCEEARTLLTVSYPPHEDLMRRSIRPECLLTRLGVASRERTAQPLGSIPLVSCLDITPDQRYLAGVVHLEDHSPARVVFWEVPTGRAVAALEWDPNAVLTDVAFSSDNETLATAQRGGIIKLWPWRRLLQA